MKTLIVYTSQTGFTKKYTDWLSERTGAETLDIKEAQKKDDAFFEGYDAIVYAGWIMAGKIVKLNWFLEKAQGWRGKRLAFFGVGGSPADSPDIAVTLKNSLTDEQREYISAFYCQGGFNYEKMNLPSRVMMKMFVGSLKKRKDATPEQREMAEQISKSYDISDKKYIEPIAAYLEGEN